MNIKINFFNNVLNLLNIRIMKRERTIKEDLMTKNGKLGKDEHVKIILPKIPIRRSRI